MYLVIFSGGIVIGESSKCCSFQHSQHHDPDIVQVQAGRTGGGDGCLLSQS